MASDVAPDEPIGIPSDQPARWLSVAAALDYFAMLRGWTLCRKDC